MEIFGTILVKLIMFQIDVVRFFKGKLGDEVESEILDTVEEGLLSLIKSFA